jgi:hypothetical protein
VEQTYNTILKEVLDRVVQNNQQLRPGTPLAELKEAIEAALSTLPPLEFKEFTAVLDGDDAAQELIDKAPELIGWNADKIIQWIKELSPDQKS